MVGIWPKDAGSPRC